MKFLIKGLLISTILLGTNLIYAQDVDEYVILSPEQYKVIEDKMFKQEDWIPILIEGHTKAELVAFYVQSYSENTIATWVDKAYEKMHKYQTSKPSEEQDVEFKKILDLPRTAKNMHGFMMIMTAEQIETVGY